MKILILTLHIIATTSGINLVNNFTNDKKTITKTSENPTVKIWIQQGACICNSKQVYCQYKIGIGLSAYDISNNIFIKEGENVLNVELPPGTYYYKATKKASICQIETEQGSFILAKDKNFNKTIGL
jgi:hypothetical protein